MSKYLSLIPGHTLRGHGDKISALVLSKNNQELYSASWDYLVKQWHVQTGTHVRTFYHDHMVLSLVLSSDDRFLFCSSYEGKITQWDTRTGERVQIFTHTFVNLLLLSSDSHTLFASDSEGTIQKWDITTGTCCQMFQGHDGYITALCMSRDEANLFSASVDKTVKQWHVSSGNCLRTYYLYHSWVKSLLWSGEDPNTLLLGCIDHTIRKCSVVPIPSHQNQEHSYYYVGDHSGIYITTSGRINQMLLSKDGRFLYAAASQSLEIWDMQKTQRVQVYQFQSGTSVNNLVLSSDDRTLFSGATDATIKQWWKLDTTLLSTCLPALPLVLYETLITFI